MDWKNSNFLNVQSIQSNLWFNAIIIKMTMPSFTEIEKLYPEIHMELQMSINT
jgi:hypothetical protein